MAESGRKRENVNRGRMEEKENGETDVEV